MNENNQKPIDPTFNVRELIEDSIRRLDDIRKIEVERLAEKIDDKDQKYQIQFGAAKEAVAAALNGTKEAINKADVTTDKRFDLLSEKIDGVVETINKNTGERGIYVTHSDLSIEMEKLRNSFELMLRPVVTFMNSQTGKSSGLNMGWIYLIGAVSLFGTIISIFLGFAK